MDNYKTTINAPYTSCTFQEALAAARTGRAIRPSCSDRPWDFQHQEWFDSKNVFLFMKEIQGGWQILTETKIVGFVEAVVWVQKTGETLYTIGNAGAGFKCTGSGSSAVFTDSYGGNLREVHILGQYRIPA